MRGHEGKPGKRAYPTLYEKLVPIVLALIVLAILVVLAIAVAVALGFVPGSY